MMKSGNNFGLSVLLLGSALGVTALAQSSAPPSPPAQDSSSTATVSTSTTGYISPSDKGTYATGQPLEMQSKEGFWGHVNPFARKKWVKRQIDPVKDRVNELDQLQAKNANDIRDVDTRAQAGIHHAQDTANTAEQNAQNASTQANAAQTLATTASTRTNSLGNTVNNLDQYQQVSAADVPFASGRTTLGPKGKSDLDNLATALAGEKGYIIEIEGYSRSGVQSSQAMADAVARYLVTEHQVPVYRIYTTGMGRNKSANSENAVVNGVHVSLMHNSLATMGADSASNAAPAAPAATTSSQSGVSNPQEVN
jgi:outer membrane protein OmpA-like peptidoglycan-associated protein